MSGTSAIQPQPVPTVDEGNPPAGLAGLWRELAPAPGRLSNTVRIVVLVLLTVAIAETFRLSNAALSAYIVLFVSRSERASTVLTAVLGLTSILAGIALAILLFMASLSQPALRLPLMAVITFAAMFASRISPLGPILFPAGFIAAYGMTLGDQVLGLALQPADVANTAEFSLPELAYLPPEEALVHFLLWLGLAVTLAVALVVFANLLTGREPALLLRAALAERLEAASRFCRGDQSAAVRLEALAREGSAALLKLQSMSRGARKLQAGEVLVPAVQRLSIVLLAAARLKGTLPDNVLAEAGRIAGQAAHSLRTGAAPDLRPARIGDVAGSLAGPLAAELSAALMTLQAGFTPDATMPPPKERKPAGLFVPDAWSNADHVHFALKVTLAVMLSYIVEDLADWPGIHTIIITCFFVSLGTVGETGHKASLRLIGCLIGGTLGILTILLLMPRLVDLGDLLVVLAPVTFLAAWIGNGSERIAYAGWQIALAFYLAVLQGFGPTLNMETARDRIVGILAGNLVIYVIFSTIWPVRVGTIVRQALADAVNGLADLIELPMHTDAEQKEEDGLRQAFGAAITRARGVLVNDSYETEPGPRRPIDSFTVLQVQALILPISTLLSLRAGPSWHELSQPLRESVLAHHRALGAWLRGSATWILSGVGAASMMRGPPVPFAPDLSGGVTPSDHAGVEAYAAWFDVLHRDIRAILDRVAPSPVSVVSTSGSALLAPG